ncbi:MAG: hypothetical protein R3338_12295, partial [Thermoanaerobaculia bacterium]|nr:hypothetical protein [Thermoanaerobaculia bacterium]
MRPARHYAEVTLDETWFHEEDFALETRRLEKGLAVELSDGETDSTTDFRSAKASDIEKQLLSREVLDSHRDRVLDRIRIVRPPAALRVRTFLSHIVTERQELFRALVRLELQRGTGERFALFTTPSELEADLDRLTDAASDESRRIPLRESLPTLWVGGTAGVLLHEAIGHPAGREPLSWPGWLSVLDDPAIASFETTVRGEPGKTADLLEEAPKQLRRASFRDHPMPRMSNLVATASDSGFVPPSMYVEISMTEGGDWDPLRDEVRVHISRAHLVSKRRR